MAAPVLAPRDAYVRAAGQFCRKEFGNTFRLVPCGRAFAESSTAEQAAARLLCVALAETPEEIVECSELSKNLVAAQVLESGSVIRRRFGETDVDAAGKVVQRALEILSKFTPPAGRIIAPAFPAPTMPAPPSPPAPPPAPRDVAAEIRAGLQGEPLTPLEVDTLARAVQECLRGVTHEGLRNAAIQVVENLEKIHVGGEKGKLDEFCHQVQDARNFAISRPDAGELADELVELRKCLCPRGSAHVSLIRAVFGPELQKLSG